MSLVAFDTLKFATQLQEGNFTPEQARAMTRAMVEAMAGAEVATKSDLVAVRNELEKKIDGVEHRLEQKIDGVEHRLEQKIDGVKAELEQKISESQVGTQRFILAAILSAMGINAVVILGAMFGLAKLLGH